MTLSNITDATIGFVSLAWEVTKFLVRYPFLPRCRVCGEKVHTPFAGFKGDKITSPVCWFCRDGWDRFIPVVDNKIIDPQVQERRDEYWDKLGLRSDKDICLNG